MPKCTFRLVFTLIALSQILSYGRDIHLAVLGDHSTDLSNLALVSLLEAKLSQVPDLFLVERAQIHAVLREHELSLAGLTQHRTVVQTGQLLHADAFLFVSIENTLTDRDRNRRYLLRTRLVETSQGLRLWEAYEEVTGSPLNEMAQHIADKIGNIKQKLDVPIAERIPIGLLGIHLVELDQHHTNLAYNAARLLSSSLSRIPQVLLLERSDLDVLYREKQLSPDLDPAFRESALLIEGHLKRDHQAPLQLTLQTTKGTNTAKQTYTAQYDSNQPSQAINHLTSMLLKDCLDSPTVAPWHTQKEATEFFKQGQFLIQHGRPSMAIEAFRTAHALDPKKLDYSMELLKHEYRIHHPHRTRRGNPNSFENVTPSLSAIALAELAGLMVQQTREAYLHKEMTLNEILTQWNHFFGPYQDGYLASDLSFSSPEVRRLNNRTRHLCYEFWNQALEQERLNPENPYVNHSTRMNFAWLSSDNPDDVLENLINAIAKALSPISSTHDTMSVGEKSSLCDMILRRMCSKIVQGHHLNRISPNRSNRNRALANIVNACQEECLAYIKTLTQHKDPVVRFYALIVSYQWPGNTAQDHAPILSHYYQIVNTAKQEQGDSKDMLTLHNSMCDLLPRLRIGRQDRQSLWDDFLNPLIKNRDMQTLKGLRLRGQPDGMSDVLYQRMIQFMRGDEEERYKQKLARDSGRPTAILPPKSKGGYVAQLQIAHMKTGNLAFDPILSRHVWPRTTQCPEVIEASFPFTIKVFDRDPDLWVTFGFEGYRHHSLEKKRIPSNTGLEWVYGIACIDLKSRQIRSLVQFMVESHVQAATRCVVNRSSCYISYRGRGILKLPAMANKTKQYLQQDQLHYLTQGLPSLDITAIACHGDQLAVAYMEESGSGLGLYYPETGHWQRLYASGLKNDRPLCDGRTYTIHELIPIGTDQYIATVFHTGERAPGLWRLNLSTGEAGFLGKGGSVNTMALNARIYKRDSGWLFQSPYHLMEFDPINTQGRLLLGKPRWLYFEKDTPSIPYQSTTILSSSVTAGITFSYRNGVDLSTAAIHDNAIWARYGYNKLIKMPMKPGEKATVFDNVFEHGRIQLFYSTPYGLLGIGEGAIGFVDIQSEQ
jgi:hypothetical protein